jgi:hypothetical protein
MAPDPRYPDLTGAAAASAGFDVESAAPPPTPQLGAYPPVDGGKPAAAAPAPGG